MVRVGRVGINDVRPIMTLTLTLTLTLNLNLNPNPNLNLNPHPHHWGAASGRCGVRGAVVWG